MRDGGEGFLCTLADLTFLQAQEHDGIEHVEAIEELGGILAMTLVAIFHDERQRLVVCCRVEGLLGGVEELLVEVGEQADGAEVPPNSASLSSIINYPQRKKGLNNSPLNCLNDVFNILVCHIRTCWKAHTDLENRL